MADRMKIQLLVALLLIAAAVYFYQRNTTTALPTVLSADTRFQPLNVNEPALQLDRLEQLQNDEYAGTKRNIFVAAPPPPPPGAEHPEAPRAYVGPQPPAPPPPLQIPVEFYGIESLVGGKPVALFKNGEDVLIVKEGDTFLNRYRLVRIGNDSADVEEVSSGRHATVPLVAQNDQAGGPPQN
jgi:hypothetical protein